MLSFLAKYWKWILGAILVVILLTWVNSRAQLTGKLWGMLFQGIKDDRAEVQQQLIDVVNQTAEERDALKKKLVILQADKERIQREKCDLENEMSILQGRLNAVVVPPASDPDAVVDALNRVFGPGARVYNNP